MSEISNVIVVEDGAFTERFNQIVDKVRAGHAFEVVCAEDIGRAFRLFRRTIPIPRKQ